MKKFDLVFEKALSWLNETNGTNYAASTFFDNVYALVKLLSTKNNNYLAKKNVNAEDEQSVRSFAEQTIKQKSPQITLDTNPPIQIVPSQVPDTEDFSVEIYNLSKGVGDPEHSNKFSNSDNKAIFDQVMSFIKTATIKQASPEAAVDQLPPTEGAEAQPGAEQSALPKA